jgi:tetratricopeptide (TPR) repeat protein
MDAEKSLKIAARRFQNGNYLLSLKKYGQARTEFEVALTLYEKNQSYKEIAEALNNIGLTLLKDGQANYDKDFFVRSYETKKSHANATRESMFNTLYNLMSISGSMTPDEFESYFLEMKMLGESLGGEYLGIVEREKAVYDSVVARRATDLKKKQEESLARSSPTGALEHLLTAGLPFIVRVEFTVSGFAVDLPSRVTYLDQKKLITIENLHPAAGLSGKSTSGTVEFETAHEIVRELMESAPAKAGRLGDEAFEHVKRFMLSLAIVREDIGFSLNHRSFSIGLVSLKNAFGEPMDIYRADAVPPEGPVTLSSEDVMMLNMMLSSEPAVYKLLLLNARRLLDEENYTLSIVDAVTAFDAFLNALLRSSLTGDHILDYTSVEDCSLYDRVLYLKKLIADSYDGEISDTLVPYLGEYGQDLDDAIVCYERVMAGEKMTAAEAEKTLKAIDRAVYDLKSKYGI